MRTAYLVAALTLLAGWSAGVSAADDYPTRPLRIVTSGIGGSADFVSRVLAQGLTTTLNQQVIVENRPNGPMSVEIVARSVPDGYTLHVSANSLWIGKLLKPELNYDPVKDFTPLTLATTSPNVVLVNPSLPVHSIKELIALAKAKPGQLNWGSGTAGASSHLAGELLKAMAGINIVRIPYGSNAQQMTDLIGGRIQMMFSNATAAAPQMKAGRLRGIAVSTAKRSVFFPDLPAIAETVPGYDSGAINGVLGPARMSPVLVKRLNQELVRVLKLPETKARLDPAGVEAVATPPEGLSALIKSDVAKWSKIIKDTGIKAEE